MRIRALAVAVSLLPASLLIAAADGDAACETREVEHKKEMVSYEACEGQVWFTDARPGLGNLAETGAVARPTWSTDAPAGSYQAGNGFATVGSPAPYVGDPQNEAGSAIFEGTFDGAIDTMTVRIHGSHLGYASTGDPTTRKEVSMNFKLHIDGAAVIPGLLIEDVPMQPAPNAQGLDEYTFTFINLDKGMARAGLDFDPAASHTISLTMAPNYVNTGAYAFWVYGADEVDGGIVFNDMDLAEDAFVIKA